MVNIRSSLLLFLRPFQNYISPVAKIFAMATGTFCGGVAPFLICNKNFNFEGKELLGQKRKNTYEKEFMETNDLMAHNSCKVASNSMAMTELRNKILIFRDLLNLPSYISFASVNELVIRTLKDLHTIYPDCVTINSILKRECSNAQIYETLIEFCDALRSVGGMWTNNDDQWLAKCKNNVNDLDNYNVEQFALAMLEGLIKVASENLLMDVEKEIKDGSYRFAKALSGYYSDKTPFCGSPVTPTSVLPELMTSPKLSYSPPLLLPLRIEAVGKLSPINVKHLSIHMFSHTLGQASKALELINKPIIEPNLSEAKSKPELIDKDSMMTMDAVELPMIIDSNKKICLEERIQSHNSSIHPILTTDPVKKLMLPLELPSLPSTLSNVETTVPTTPKPTMRLSSIIGALPLSPLSFISTSPSVAKKTEGDELPSTFLASEMVAALPTASALMSLGYMSSPPPPTSLPPNSMVDMITTAIKLPSSPTVPSLSPPLPPPPPPLMTASNIVISSPPLTTTLNNMALPPPVPMVPSKGSGSMLPPPLQLEKGGAPPPPPIGIKSILCAKKATTKLKRSSQMGSLYRLLKGKVEGSSLDGKSPQGRKGNKMGSSSGGKQGMADALAEMTKRSAYFQQIEEDVINHAQPIKEMKIAICSFETPDMSKLMKFHKHVESHLEKLTDESQVLARFEDFPTKKLESMRMAAALFSKLNSMVTTLQEWKIESPANQILDKIEGYFNKIKGELETLERNKDEESNKFKANKIHFDFNIIILIKELMVDVSASCMEVALKENREAKAKETQELCGTKKRSAKLLWKAFQFAFRVYTFAGGHDDRADMLTRELALEIETDPHH